MESQRRALRRHHVARRKQWAQRELAHMIDCHEGRRRRKFVGMLANTPKLCSCWMCGNPRRYLGEPPYQEIRRPSASCSGDGDRRWAAPAMC